MRIFSENVIRWTTIIYLIAFISLVSTTQAAPIKEEKLTHHYQMINDIKIHYVMAGHGKPVLLILDWMQTWYAWRFIIPKLATNGFQVIAVDPRSMGYSSKPQNGYDMAQVANDLNQLMRQLGYQQYDVVGHDIGMWIAYAMASDYPQNISKLAIMEAKIPGLLNPEPIVFMDQKESAFFWHFMFNQQPDLPELLIQGKEREYLSYIFTNWSVHSEKIALDEYTKIYQTPGSIRSQMAYYRAFPETIKQNKQRAKHKLTMPVLILGADHSLNDLGKIMMAPVTQQLTSATLKNCGHFAPEECPDEILNQLIPFLQKN